MDASKNTGSCPKIMLRQPIEIERSLNLRASMPMLYVKNKMAEASLLPQRKRNKFFHLSRFLI